MKSPPGKSAICALLLAFCAMPAALPLVLPAAARAQENHPLPRRGDYLPQEVLQSGPKVDYGALHLRRPPVGYGWFQLGRNFVMASVATGLIVEVVVP